VRGPGGRGDPERDPVRDSEPEIVFARLGEVDRSALIDLMNDPRVRRHLPLAVGAFGPAEYDRFLTAKEQMWQQCGYGPWAFMVNGDFAGWGGLQPEGDDADVGLVLHPRYWGLGRLLYQRIIDFAFREMGLRSVITLLPPSRTRARGLLRLGFLPDGELTLAGRRFIRYRLMAH